MGKRLICILCMLVIGVSLVAAYFVRKDYDNFKTKVTVMEIYSGNLMTAAQFKDVSELGSYLDEFRLARIYTNLDVFINGQGYAMGYPYLKTNRLTNIVDAFVIINRKIHEKQIIQEDIEYVSKVCALMESIGRKYRQMLHDTSFFNRGDYEVLRECDELYIQISRMSLEYVNKNR